jgi:RimJ/RimL family protein N-acetyltransferase
MPGPWTHGFAVLERAGSTTVGACGFKGPPDADGVVEVAYGIEPAYQGRGYAKETVSALVEFADQAGAQVVRAHTKPDNGPSAGVLAGCGFLQIGEVVDPEDGRVCRWERRVRPSTGRPAA